MDKGTHMQETHKFTLRYGLMHEGAIQREGALRLPTLQDLEEALEALEPTACKARVDRHVWARTIVSLGDIPAGSITPELLGGLVDEDYGAILEAENTLRKKRLAGNAANG